MRDHERVSRSKRVRETRNSFGQYRLVSMSLTLPIPLVLSYCPFPKGKPGTVWRESSKNTKAKFWDRYRETIDEKNRNSSCYQDSKMDRCQSDNLTRDRTLHRANSLIEIASDQYFRVTERQKTKCSFEPRQTGPCWLVLSNRPWHLHSRLQIARSGRFTHTLRVSLYVRERERDTHTHA